MLKKIVWCVLVFGLLGTTVSAQSPATAFTARYYTVGGTVAVQQEIWTATSVTCNQTLPTVLDTTDPTRIYWTDTVASTPTAPKYCVYTTATTGSQLRSLPVGPYEGTLAANNSAGASAESARVPFSKPAAAVTLPAVPSGVRFLKD